MLVYFLLLPILIEGELVPENGNIIGHQKFPYLIEKLKFIQDNKVLMVQGGLGLIYAYR